MSFNLVCNYKNCCKEIVSTGWVTNCSHVFCEVHGTTIKRNWKSLKCPACGKAFKDNCSIMETKVNPSKEYKSIAHLGLKPSDALEIANNSIRFWMYQINSESDILRKKSEHYRQKLIELKNTMEHNKQLYEQKISNLNKELEEAKFKIQDLNMKIMEKNQRNYKSPMPERTSNVIEPSLFDFFE